MLSSKLSQRIPAWMPPTCIGCKPAFGNQFCCKLSEPRKIVRSNVSLCNMLSSGNSADVDDYAQFAEMLGMDSNVQARNADNVNQVESASEDASASQYAEFADLLGTEGQDPTNETPNKIEKAVPKKTEINPADYDIFDSLLQRSGGTGRKQVRGSKRYLSAPIRKEPSKPNAFQQRPEMVDMDDDSDRAKSPYLTEEETAQAYAVMMEEFGTGMHGNIPVAADGVDIEDLSVDIPELQKPPARPTILPDEEEKLRSQYSYIPDVSIPPAQDTSSLPGATLEPPSLQKPPTRPQDMPVHDDKLRMQYSNIETANAPPAQKASAPPDLQNPPTRPTDMPVHDDQVRMQYAQIESTQAEPVQEIVSPPELQKPPLRPDDMPVHDEELRKQYASDRMGLPVVEATPSDLQPKPVVPKSADIASFAEEQAGTDLAAVLSTPPSIPIEFKREEASTPKPDNASKANTPVLTMPPPRRQAQAKDSQSASMQPNARMQPRLAFSELPTRRLENPKLVYRIEQ